MLKYISILRDNNCLIVNLYYYIGTKLAVMKILPSSPYAVFNTKEWDSLLNSHKKINKNSVCKLEKYYYKNLKKIRVKNSARNEIKKTKLIQLSFA